MNTIESQCGSMILLKFIESFTPFHNLEDMVIDKLKDDYCFSARTISGKEYYFSIKAISEKIGNNDNSPYELAQAIFDKWKHIHRETQ